MLVRRVVGTELLWVKRKDDEGMCQIPKGHIWVEGEGSMTNPGIDSLNKLGPISQSLIHGEVKAVIWPPQQMSWFDNIVNLKRLDEMVRGRQKQTHS